MAMKFVEGGSSEYISRVYQSEYMREKDWGMRGDMVFMSFHHEPDSVTELTRAITTLGAIPLELQQC
jgi:hypothetical protein